MKKRSQKVHDVQCPYCQQPAVLMDSAEFYGGRSYGPVYACIPCEARVGCHKGTYEPLGVLANAALRNAKKAAHDAFDPIWRGDRMPSARTRAYQWLARQLGIPPGECHIGMFDEVMCRRVVEVCAASVQSECE